MNKSKIVLLVVVFALTAIQFSCNTTVKDKKVEELNVESTKVDVDVEATPKNSVKTDESNTSTGDIRIAYVNTDTLMANYNYYMDAVKKIETYEKQLKRQYETKAEKLKQDYEAYISQGKAGMLTLQQQKDTEAKLTQQQNDLMLMEQNMTQESGLKRQEISGKVTQAIVDFLDGYRIENGYTFILQYGSMSGLLSADPSFDITTEVVERLNRKYDFERNH
jgi:outer membrane protein